MKTEIIAILSVALISVASFGGPSSKNEGVSSEIPADALTGLDSWVENTKQDIDRGLFRATHTKLKERERHLRDTLDAQLAKQVKYTDEFMSRNILYRAVEVHNMLLKVPRDAKRDAFAIRFLTESLSWAEELAPNDVVLMKNHKVEELIAGPSRVNLGLKWALWLVDMSYSLPSNESHLQTLRMITGFLVNDIILDEGHNRYLAGIAKILKEENDALLTAEKQTLTPLQKLEVIKQARELLINELGRTAATIKLQLTSVSLSSPASISDPPKTPSDANVGKRELVYASNGVFIAYDSVKMQDNGRCGGTILQGVSKGTRGEFPCNDILILGGECENGLCVENTLSCSSNSHVGHGKLIGFFRNSPIVRFEDGEITFCGNAVRI